MPTKKKRVGFIPRADVMIIIDRLGIENNLSNSKIISILVEEALSSRGLFNKKNGKKNQSYQSTEVAPHDLSKNSAEFIDNAKLSINTKLGKDINSSKSTLLKQTNQDAFDLQTYKKFLSFLQFQEMMEKYSN